MTNGLTGPGRRKAIKRVASGAAAVWAAPAITTWDAVAAACGSPIQGLSGQFTEATLSTGESLASTDPQYSSNTSGFVFLEKSATLASPQATDSGGPLPAGVSIQSYLIHFSRASGQGSVSGSLTIPGTILGWDHTNASLAASDTTWGIDDVDYDPTAPGRRLESHDTVSVDTATGLVTLNLRTNYIHADQVRIYAAC